MNQVGFLNLIPKIKWTDPSSQWQRRTEAGPSLPAKAAPIMRNSLAKTGVMGKQGKIPTPYGHLTSKENDREGV